MGSKRAERDEGKGTVADGIIESASNLVMDVMRGAIDETGMSKRQAALMKKELVGRWRITRMDLLDKEAMDEESPAFIEFKKSGGGEFHFCFVGCEIEWVAEQRQGRPGVAFTFEGSDEMDDAAGRGWAAVQIDGKLRGQLYFHRGEKSGFWGDRGE